MAVAIAKWSCDIYCSTCGSEATIDRNTVVADAGAGGGLPSHLLAPHASELAIPKCWMCSAGQHELVKATFADSYVTELGAGSSAESSAEASHHARKLKAKSRKVGKRLQTGDPWKKTKKKTLEKHGRNSGSPPAVCAETKVSQPCNRCGTDITDWCSTCAEAGYAQARGHSVITGSAVKALAPKTSKSPKAKAAALLRRPAGAVLKRRPAASPLQPDSEPDDGSSTLYCSQSEEEQQEQDTRRPMPECDCCFTLQCAQREEPHGWPEEPSHEADAPVADVAVAPESGDSGYLISKAIQLSDLWERLGQDQTKKRLQALLDGLNEAARSSDRDLKKMKALRNMVVHLNEEGQMGPETLLIIELSKRPLPGDSFAEKYGACAVCGRMTDPSMARFLAGCPHCGA